MLAAALASIPLALAIRRLLTLTRAFPTHPGPLQRALPRAAEAIRSRIEGCAAAFDGDPLHALFVALAREDGPVRDAELNEALDDLDRRLAGADPRSGAYLRVYAFGGVFVTTVAVLLGGASAGSLVQNGLPLASLVAVAGWSFWLVDRWSSAIARELRADLDALVERTLSRTGAPPEILAKPSPSKRATNHPRRGHR